MKPTESRGEDAHKGHRDRLRQRALATHLEGMPSHEILELLLTYSIPWRDVNELAHELIRRFGSLDGVLHAQPGQLAVVPGMGSSTEEFLLLAGRTLDEYARGAEGEDGPEYSRAVDMAQALSRMRLADGYYIVCLNTRGRLRRVEPLPWDNATAWSLGREMMVSAIRNRAYNVALARKGGGEFSPVDYQVMDAFARLTNGLEILLMDVLLLCDSGQVRSLRRAMDQDAVAGPGSPAFADPIQDVSLAFPRWLEDME